ncbi:hypothetical protein E3N88_26034 [Mikania micrantha]|uniref:DUF4408 domain-containing protein n=1 Tax=Mikania micrantha TaxID=192012 RepID=A0A5N6N6E0_9ASTR|nr:hypothetical protein E3N88_26034 [Mikania micrantha]
MVPLRIHAYKASAIKKHKAHQLLNDFILYSLTTLACMPFCSSPLWYPPFCATFNVFFFFSVPKMTSFFFTSKGLFIVGNVIVIFLLGESKFFDSKFYGYNDVCHKKYACKHKDQLQGSSQDPQHKGAKTIEDTPKQEMTVKILESKTHVDNDHHEFFEAYHDGETCESDVDRLTESSGHDDVVKEVEEEEEEGLKGLDQDLFSPTEELNRLIDDFIARINRQRKLEAEFSRV